MKYNFNKIINEIDPNYKKYAKYALEKDKKEKYMKRAIIENKTQEGFLKEVAHIATNQFIKKTLGTSLVDNNLIKDLPKERVFDMLRNKHELQQYVIGCLALYNTELFEDTKIVNNLLEKETQFMIVNFLPALIREHPRLIFTKYFDAAYLHNNKEVDKYVREKYGRDTDIKTLYSELAKINKE